MHPALRGTRLARLDDAHGWTFWTRLRWTWFSGTRGRTGSVGEDLAPVEGKGGKMGKRVLIVAAVVVVLATAAVGISLAQAGSATASRSRHTIHVVVPTTGGHSQFFDFNGDGLTLGDRLAAVAPMLNVGQTERVGTAYGDCWVGALRLHEGSPYVCSYILKFKRGTITTEGLDPHGASDVFFSITGGTGAYQDIGGQAEYIDTEPQTDIIIRLDG
jgi:hypothetical protein